MTKFDDAWVTREKAKRAWMAENGLYKSDDEHASCGVGLVVSIDGKKSRKVVENGIAALKAVWHRGAVDADGKTGDGCGLLLQKPDGFLRAVAQNELKITLADQYGIGAFMLNRDEAKAEAAKQAILDAGGEIRTLDDASRAAWVDAMKPVWSQFEGDVGADNIAAAQAINAES